MCDKNIPENGEMLKFVHDCYENQKMYNTTFDNYSCA